MLAKIVAAILLFFAMPITAGFDSSGVTIVVMLLFIAAIVSLFLGNSPLAVKKFHKGEFWVSGCSQEFLGGIESAMTT